MAEKKVGTKSMYRVLILVSKVIPIITALVHFINMILSYFNINDIPLNYIGGISFLSLVMFYVVSYALGFCEYHRMFIHYCVVVNIVNVIDYYIGISISNLEYLILGFIITIIAMAITLYLKIKNI